MAAIPAIHFKMGESQIRGPALGGIAYQIHRIAALACEAIRGRVTSRSRTYAPRNERKPVHMEVSLIGSDEDMCSGGVHSRVNQMLAVLRSSQPHWLGTARFHVLPVQPEVSDQVFVTTDPETGASCRCRVFYDGVRAERVIAVDWLFEPVHAPGTWTRRKRRARYRRGRETVRPRQRGLR